MKTKLINLHLLNDSNHWIAEIGANKNLVGCTTSGDWCVSIAGGINFLESEEHFISLLPLLECKRIDFMNHLEALGLTRTGIKTFPEVRLLLCATNYQGSEYWFERAVLWMENTPDTIMQFRSLVDLTLINKNLTQKLQHRFNRMLKV